MLSEDFSRLKTELKDEKLKGESLEVFVNKNLSEMIGDKKIQSQLKRRRMK